MIIRIFMQKSRDFLNISEKIFRKFEYFKKYHFNREKRVAAPLKERGNKKEGENDVELMCQGK